MSKFKKTHFLCHFGEWCYKPQLTTVLWYCINLILRKSNHYIYIHLESRQLGRFAGFSLYISNIDVLSIDAIQGSTLCYKDGPQLPSLNFTTTCIEYGRYLIFYNERRTGVSYPEGYEVDNVYTELCEVSVAGKLSYDYKPKYVYRHVFSQYI